MDPVSLTLGLLPLIGGTVKGVKKTRTKLHALKNYADGVKRVHLRFMILESHVRAQSTLLVRHARAAPLNINIGNALFEQTILNLPAALSLDDAKIREYVGDSYDACQELFLEISSKVTLIHKTLEQFEPDQAQNDPVRLLVVMPCLL